MSIPRRDPNFTTADLQKSAERLMETAYAYWEDAARAGIDGAVIWVQDADGKLVIFTRSEYRETLMSGIEKIGVPRHFGAAGGNEEGIENDH